MISLTTEHRAAFNSLGMATINNAMPEDTAINLREAYLAAEYEEIIQERPEHYQHVFHTEHPELPDAREKYLARFNRSFELEKHPLIQETYKTYIKPCLENISEETLNSIDLRAYKMVPGDFFRAHIDAYAGETGFIYYLCKGWKWDWGGILMTMHNKQMIPVIPKYNQLLILNHRNERPPHFVSQIADYALEPRYMLVGFASNETHS